jgi:GNAT superfamily N-acetyltransferase
MSHSHPALTIRAAELRDVPHLVDLNRAAYPDLIQDEVIWTEPQLRAHLEVFPRGQLLAEVSGRYVGAISTLIAHRDIEPLAPHTWLGITDGGYFTRHDEGGDTLYLADIYVHPDAWGKGVGSSLYAALRDLCRRLRLRRVVAGGRLWGYADVADRMSAEEYVARALRGELRDRVLMSQLRAGFVVRGLLPNYLHDWRSGHFATLLEWTNPDHAGAPGEDPKGWKSSTGDAVGAPGARAIAAETDAVNPGTVRS